MNKRTLLGVMTIIIVTTIYCFLYLLSNNLLKIVNYDFFYRSNLDKPTTFQLLIPKNPENIENDITDVCNVLRCEYVLRYPNYKENVWTSRILFIKNIDNEFSEYYRYYNNRLILSNEKKKLEVLSYLGFYNITNTIQPAIYIKDSVYVLSRAYFYKVFVLYLCVLFIILSVVYFINKIYLIKVTYNNIIDLIDMDIINKLNENINMYDVFIHKLAIGLEVLEATIRSIKDNAIENNIDTNLLQFSDLNKALTNIKDILEDLKKNKTVDNNKILTFLHYVKRTSINNVIIDANDFNIEILDEKIKNVIDKNSFIFYSDKLLLLLKNNNPIVKIKVSNTKHSFDVEIQTKRVINNIDTKTVNYLDKWLHILGVKLKLICVRNKVTMNIIKKKSLLSLFKK